MIVPNLRDNSSPPRQKNVKNFERNILFRHEVEKSNYKPRKFYTESPLLAREIDEPSAKSHRFEKTFRHGTGSLPLSDPKKPLTHSEFSFNP